MNRLQIVNTEFRAGNTGWLVQDVVAGAGGGTIELSNIWTDAFGVIIHRTNAIVDFNNIISGGTWGFYCEAAAAAAVTFTGGGISPALTHLVNTGCHVICRDMHIDLSTVGKANGDQAWNSNGALACGLGPAISNGTNWKNSYSGSVY